MNRKNLPLILMLTVGAVTCIITYVREFSIPAKLVSLFAVLVIFYLFGNVLNWTIDRFERQNEEKLKEEGEMIEKEAEETEDSEEEKKD